MSNLFVFCALVALAGVSAGNPVPDTPAESPPVVRAKELTVPLAPMNGTFAVDCACVSEYSCDELFSRSMLVLQDGAAITVRSVHQRAGVLKGVVDAAGDVSVSGFLGAYTACNGTYNTFGRGELVLRCFVGQHKGTSPQCVVALNCADGKCLETKAATSGSSHPSGPNGTISSTGAAIASGFAVTGMLPDYDSPSYAMPDAFELMLLVCTAAACCVCCCCCLRRCRRRACNRPSVRPQPAQDRVPLVHQYAASVAPTSARPTPAVQPMPQASAPAMHTQQAQSVYFYPPYPMQYYPHPAQQHVAAQHPAISQPMMPFAQPSRVASPPVMQRANPTGAPAPSGRTDTSSDEHLARALQAQYDNEASLV